MNLQALQCYQMIVVNYTLKRIYPKILYLWTKKVVRNIAMAKKKKFYYHRMTRMFLEHLFLFWILTFPTKIA